MFFTHMLLLAENLFANFGDILLDLSTTQFWFGPSGSMSFPDFITRYGEELLIISLSAVVLGYGFKLAKSVLGL